MQNSTTADVSARVSSRSGATRELNCSLHHEAGRSYLSALESSLRQLQGDVNKVLTEFVEEEKVQATQARAAGDGSTKKTPAVVNLEDEEELDAEEPESKKLKA